LLSKSHKLSLVFGIVSGYLAHKSPLATSVGKVHAIIFRKFISF